MITLIQQGSVASTEHILHCSWSTAHSERNLTQHIQKQYLDVLKGKVGDVQCQQIPEREREREKQGGGASAL